MFKDLSLAALVLLMVGLAGCEPAAYAVSSDSNKVAVVKSEGKEYCYLGVVYVRFSSGNGSWGGAKFGPDGKVITCN